MHVCVAVCVSVCTVCTVCGSKTKAWNIAGSKVSKFQREGAGSRWGQHVNMRYPWADLGWEQTQPRHFFRVLCWNNFTHTHNNTHTYSRPFYECKYKLLAHSAGQTAAGFPPSTQDRPLLQWPVGAITYIQHSTTNSALGQCQEQQQQWQPQPQQQQQL